MDLVRGMQNSVVHRMDGVAFCGSDPVLLSSMDPTAPLLFLSIQDGDSVGSKTFDQTAPDTDRRAASRRRGRPPFRPVFEVDVGNATTFASMRRNARS